MVSDLFPYHFTVHHASGNTNTVAGALSRIANAEYVLKANDSCLFKAQNKDTELVTTTIADIETAGETVYSEGNYYSTQILWQQN